MRGPGILLALLCSVLSTCTQGGGHSPPRYSLAILAAGSTMSHGTSLQLDAIVRWPDGSSMTVTEEVLWEASPPGVVQFATAAGTRGLATGMAPGLATVRATVPADRVVATMDLRVISAELTAIEVSPPLPSVAVGYNVPFAATGTYTDLTTRDLTTAVVWASTNEGVAVVDGVVSGQQQIRGVGVGTTVITATDPIVGVVGSTTLTVTAAALVSIAVTPALPSIALGYAQQFAATGTFSDNSTQDLTTAVTWSSGTLATATISNAGGTEGLATSVATGTTAITATHAATSIAGSTTLTVTAAALVSIAVTPALPSIALGYTQQFAATGTFSDNSTQDLTTAVTWSSGTLATATISNAGGTEGLATSVATGTTAITATHAATSIAGSTTLTVTAAVLVSIAVTPALPSIALGYTQQFAATGTFSDNSTQDLTTAVTWSSGTLATATISNAGGTEGLATSVATGTTVITATHAATSIAGSTTLTVTAAVLVSIAVTPALPSIALGYTQQFAATGTFSDNSTQDLTTAVTWSSGTLATATISNAGGTEGLATSVATGTTTITATHAATSIAGSTTLTVTAAVLVSIAVTPALPSIALGYTQQFAATGTFSDNSTQDLTTAVTWSSGRWRRRRSAMPAARRVWRPAWRPGRRRSRRRMRRPASRARRR
ncbi:MAG: Ig-like domain-containing protein [Planctomycetes bacterium]|nr:Ig-like domain-containing protein [Planctomycetota bacterium]